MKRNRCISLLAAALLAAVSFHAHAQRRLPTVEQRMETLTPLHSDIKPDRTIFLYPDGQDGNGRRYRRLARRDRGYAAMRGPGESNGLKGPELPQRWGMAGNISDSARIDLYFPEKPNGQMVLVTPGGGYRNISFWNEGTYVAQWMLSRGITLGVIKYRLPNGHCEVPLTDVHNAFRYCRAHSREWGVGQIGIMGFSAGGHLAASATTMYTDSITRPDFSVLVYPVISTEDGVTEPGTKRRLVGDDRELALKYSIDRHVAADNPPVFIALSSNDNVVPAENSIRLYESLAAAGVSTEMHSYAYGGHGWGFTDSTLLDIFLSDPLGAARNDFSHSLERWLAEQREGRAKPGEKREDVKPQLAAERIVHLYPDGQDADHGLPEAMGPGESNGAKGQEVWRNGMALRNVGDSARFTIYLADKAVSTGQMVVICPGGAYVWTSQFSEGTYVARWLLGKGVSACVVQHRLPVGHWEVPLTDIQNTMRYLRAHSEELGINQIGVMGFSAGGHLAASAATLYADSITRPDFALLFYPVITMESGVTHGGTRMNLIGGDDRWIGREQQLQTLIDRYSLENQVTSDTPPTFIALCTDDDAVSAENSARFFRSLVEKGVKVEIHSFPEGGHGWGYRTEDIGTDQVPYAREDIDISLSRFLAETGKQTKKQ